MGDVLRSSRWFRSVAAATLVVLGLAASAASSAAATSNDWTAYEHGPYHRSAISGDSAITPSTVPSLHAVWKFTAATGTASDQPAPSFDASPVVVNGVAYLGSATGIFAAIRTSTGHLIWQRQLDYGTAGVCAARGTIATANVQADPTTGALTVYAPGSHYLYALNAATGAIRWRTAIGPATAAGEARWYNWSSPTIASGRIYMGLGASCYMDKVRSGEVQIDQHTGAVLHTWYDVPAGTVGATVWSSAAADGTSVWVSTGDPAPTAKQVYDAYSVVRLDAGTFTAKDKWTAALPLGADLDFGSSPTLFTARLNGKQTNMVGACNKNGIFYAWRSSALSAGPVWQNQVGVDGTTMAGACITSAAFDSGAGNLFVAANQLTSAGKLVQSMVRSLDPATGAARWTTPLNCLINGSPTVNATTHVLAVPMYSCVGSAKPGVALLDARTGAVLRSIPTAAAVFGQPVFAEGALFVADQSGTLTEYKP